MKQQLSEKGFSALILITLLVALAALAFGGWYVWQKNQDDKRTNSSSNNSPQTNNAPNEQAGKEADPSEGGKYLVISEWGVRLELPEELRGDIYYRLDKNDILKAEFASLASKKLDGLTGDDSCTFRNNPQNSGLSASLIRGLPEQVQGNPEHVRTSWRLIKKIGEYEYYFAIPENNQISCVSGTHPDLYEKERDMSNLLREAFEGLQLAP